MGRARVRRERRRVARFLNRVDSWTRRQLAWMSRREVLLAVAAHERLGTVGDLRDTRYFVGIDMGFKDQIAQVTVHQQPDGVIVIDDVQVIQAELEAAGDRPGLKALAAPLLKEVLDGQK